jgi:polar amino acid transport system substrate-binding protein
MRAWVTPGPRAAATGAALCLLASLVAACGTAPPPITTGSIAEPSPAGVATGNAAIKGSSVVNASPACVASLRPSGPLPAPAHMPAGSTMEAIYKRGYLIAGVDQSTPLLSYRDPATGRVDGFNVAIVRQVAKAIFGTENAVKLVAITSAQRQAVIQGRAVDLIADPTTITCDRLGWADFSTNYLDAHQRVLMPSASTARGIEDLGGQRVCAVAGTTSIRAIAGQPSRPVPVAVPNWSDCLAMLQPGQVAAISTTDTVLAGLQAQDPQTKVVGPTFTFEPQGLGMSKNAKDLVRFVNAVLERIRTDGE